MKTRTTSKHSLRVGVLSLLLVLPIALSGCGKSAKGLKVGNFSKPMGRITTSLNFGIKTESAIFSIDNVSLDLYIGTYDINYCEKYDCNPKSLYGLSDVSDSTRVFLALYTCEKKHGRHFSTASHYDDYQCIEDLNFVREVESDDIFSVDFGYTTGWIKGIDYNYHESLTIPQEFFTDDQGTCQIRVVMFEERDSAYFARGSRSVILDYEIKEENQIEFTFGMGHQ